MSITQDQILSIVNAGQELRKSLDNLHAEIQTIIQYEIPQTHKRLLSKNTPEDMISEFESLVMLIQDLSTAYSKELVRTIAHQTVIEHWKDHYKQRYNSNIASRRWRQRRQNLPTNLPTSKQHEEETETQPIAEYEEELLQECLKNDEWHVHPGRKPASSGDHGMWDEYVRYIRIGLRWHKIKNRPWDTVEFQYGNNVIPVPFTDAISDIDPEKLTWQGQPVDINFGPT